ncbi:MAG TPA: hypothetical protein VGM32_15120, partial [Rhodopila sp.]
MDAVYPRNLESFARCFALPRTPVTSDTADIPLTPRARAIGRDSRENPAAAGADGTPESLNRLARLLGQQAARRRYRGL